MSIDGTLNATRIDAHTIDPYRASCRGASTYGAMNGQVGISASNFRIGWLRVDVSLCWDQHIPESWRHGWPDIAVDRPSRLLEALEGDVGLSPIGEVVAAGEEPTPHWARFCSSAAAHWGSDATSSGEIAATPSTLSPV